MLCVECPHRTRAEGNPAFHTFEAVVGQHHCHMVTSQPCKGAIRALKLVQSGTLKPDNLGLKVKT